MIVIVGVLLTLVVVAAMVGFSSHVQLALVNATLGVVIALKHRHRRYLIRKYGTRSYQYWFSDPSPVAKKRARRFKPGITS